MNFEGLGSNLEEIFTNFKDAKTAAYVLVSRMALTSAEEVFGNENDVEGTYGELPNEQLLRIAGANFIAILLRSDPDLLLTIQAGKNIKGHITEDMTLSDQLNMLAAEVERLQSPHKFN